MKFQLKALAAAAILAASIPAQAALDIGNVGTGGTGELFFNVYDTGTNQSFSFDLTPQASFAQFGDFTVDSFMVADLDNAQGLADVTAGELTGGSGAAEAAGLNINWTITGNQAFTNFAAANPNSANWQWNVVALDTTGTATARNGRRFLSTVESSVVTPINQTSGNFTSMGTVGPFLTQINAADASADPSAYLTGPFNTTFGDAWLGRFVDSTSAVNTAASFYYLTGRSTTAINEVYENAAAWKFSFVNNVATLNYSTAAVPEPETYAMMLAGLGMMGFMARRRRSNLS